MLGRKLPLSNSITHVALAHLGLMRFSVVRLFNANLCVSPGHVRRKSPIRSVRALCSLYIAVAAKLLDDAVRLTFVHAKHPMRIVSPNIKCSCGYYCHDAIGQPTLQIIVDVARIGGDGS